MTDSVVASANDLTNNNDVSSASGKVTDTTVASIESNLVSWWEMNETDGDRFDSHAGNNLTSNNSVGFALGHIQEPIGSERVVADFVSASTESLSSSNSAFTFGNESFSFGGWFKSDNTNYQYWCGKIGNSGQYSYALYQNGSGIMSVYISSNG